MQGLGSPTRHLRISTRRHSVWGAEVSVLIQTRGRGGGGKNENEHEVAEAEQDQGSTKIE